MTSAARKAAFRIMPFPVEESMYSLHVGCWPTPSAGLNDKTACKRLNSTWYC